MSVPLLQQKNIMGLHRHKMPHIPRILNSLCNSFSPTRKRNIYGRKRLQKDYEHLHIRQRKILGFWTSCFQEICALYKILHLLDLKSYKWSLCIAGYTTSRKSSGALADKIPPATEASGASGPLFNALHYSLSLAYFSVFIESFLLRFSLNSHQEIKTCRSQKWKQEIQW